MLCLHVNLSLEEEGKLIDAAAVSINQDRTGFPEPDQGYQCKVLYGNGFIAPNHAAKPDDPDGGT